jgi:N-acetylglucosaminyldiphosphoundecaprenol N-acetyl-beta-D-mannosaminyltransferase
VTLAIASRSRPSLPTLALAALIVWLPLQTPVAVVLTQYTAMPATLARALLLVKDVAVFGMLVALVPLARATFRWSLPDFLAAGYVGVLAVYTIVPRLAGDQLPLMAVVSGLRELLVPVELYALGRLAGTAGADVGWLARLAIWVGFAAAAFAIVTVALVPASVWATTLDMPRFLREVQGIESARTLTSVSIAATYGEDALFIRAIGPFTHPVGAANYLVLPLVLIGGWAVARVRATPRIALAILVVGVTLVVAIVMTISRGAWLAAAIAIVVIAWRTGHLRLAVAGVLVVTAILALIPPYSYAIWSAASGSDPSTIGHGTTIENAVSVLAGNPLGLGVGYGGYFGSASGVDVVAAGETLYLTIAVAAGPAALALFVGWIAVLTMRLVASTGRTAIEQGVSDGWVRLAIGAATLGFAAMALVSSPWMRFTTAATFWMLLGLTASMAWRTRPGEREPISGQPSRTTVAGIPFDELDQRQAVDAIVARALAGEGGYVCTPNVDYVVRARRDNDFRAALLGAAMRLPDGKGVIYGSIIAGRPLQVGVTGRLLPAGIAPRLAAAGRAVALFGAGRGVAERAAEPIRRAGGLVSDAFGPGTPFQVGSDEDLAAVARLRAGKHAVIFCALGAPTQELWMARHQRELEPAVIVGVGAAFDVLSGQSKEPPGWMTEVGLEWLFRLAHEPRRLARRYLWDDPRFFWWMVRARFGGPTA